MSWGSFLLAQALEKRKEPVRHVLQGILFIDAPEILVDLLLQGGALPFGMAVIQGKNALLATDAGIGFDIIDLSNVNSNDKNSSNSKDVAVEVKDQKAVCWAAHSGKTGNFYLTDIGTSKVTEVSVDDNLQAKIVNVSPFRRNFPPYVVILNLVPLSNTNRLRALLPLTTTLLRLTTKSKSHGLPTCLHD